LPRSRSATTRCRSPTPRGGSSPSRTGWKSWSGAAVASQARIAKAQADQEAAQRELEASALKAQYERDLAIKRAGFEAESEEARARAAQAGPLSEAQASQEVIAQQTQLAVRQAELAAQKLEAEVRRPADAEAYRKRTLAEADRDQARFATEAAAHRKRALAEAEAAAERVMADAAATSNAARAASLRDGNQELIAADRLIEILPSLVEAAARGLADAQLTILNGTTGVNEVLAGLVGQGLSILETLKKPTPLPPVEAAAVAAEANGSGNLPEHTIALRALCQEARWAGGAKAG
jgi:flotillin